MRSLLLLLVLLKVVFVKSIRRAEWMSGQWGIGYRIHATPSMIASCDVGAFIDQLRTIEGLPGYVIVNLSGPAHGGDVYLSYNPTLWSLGNTLATPGPDGRDLFGELLAAIHNEGIKVIAYMAAQGPALLKAGTTRAHDWNGTHSTAYDNWVDYVELAYGNTTEDEFHQAYATDIVEFYATKYGDQLDGWWFDQGSFCDRDLVAQACRSGNPDAAIAFNYNQKVNSPGLEDYTFGHPTPITNTNASDIANYGMVTSVEGTPDGFLTDANGYESLTHLFLPMGNTWNSINYIQADGTDRYVNVWDEAQAVDWMSRVLTAGGAWTWNIPRESNSPDTLSLLRSDFVDFLNQVVVQLPPDSTDSVALDCSDYVCDEAGEYWNACVVMDGLLNQYEVCARKDSWVFIYESLSYCGSCDGYCAESVEDTDPCDDAHYCEFNVDPVSLASETCAWLSEQDEGTIAQHCNQWDTQEICPETCAMCADSCEDDIGAIIVIDGADQDCNFLAAMPDLHDEVCDPSSGSGAWQFCTETCGNCNGEYVPLWEPLDCSANACDDDGDYWSVCVVMDGILNQYYQCAAKDSRLFISPSDNYCGSCDGYCAETVKDSDPCDDAHFCRFTVDSVSLESQTCLWLSEQSTATIDQYCQQIDTQEICPETCGVCSDSCEDDSSDGTIVIEGGEETCSYLAENPDLHAEVCDPTSDSGAWDTCRETCGNCGGEYVAPWTPLDCSDHPCGAAGSQLWSVCIVMEGLLNQYAMCALETSWPFLYESQNYCGPCDGYCAETPKDTDPCDDAHYCQFTIDSTTLDSRSCAWLRDQDASTVTQYCNQVDTKEICPETCGMCSDTCEDDAVGFIVIDGVEQTCNYLAANPSLHADACDPNSDSGAWNTCSETCGNCDGEYIEPFWD